MKTIAEFQKAAYALAVERGEYSRPCVECSGRDVMSECTCCGGEGQVHVDPRSPTRIAARLERIHRAISDAGNDVEAGRMELMWKDGIPVEVKQDTPENRLRNRQKPAGFPIALATVFLRLCELAESLRHESAVLVGWSINPQTDTPEQIAAALAGVHMHVADIYSFETFGGTGWDGKRELDEALTTLVLLADATGIDINAMAELKLEYERGRK